MPQADVPYTFISPSGESSRIDHFLLSKNLVEGVAECGIIDYNLLSDHVPVKLVLSIELPQSLHIQKEDRRGNKIPTRIAWNHAKDEDFVKYKRVMNEKLSYTAVNQEMGAFVCNDICCNNKKHEEDITCMYRQLLTIMIESANECIPSTRSGSKKSYKKSVSGWEKYVKEYQQVALHWHSVWKSEGRPHQGYTAEMRKISRARYHQAVRKVKRDQDDIKKEKLADALYNNDNRELWAEIRRMKGAKVSGPISIDNITEEDKIADICTKKYYDLYNSVSYDPDDMRDSCDKINNLINNQKNEQLNMYRIAVDDVKKAVKNLKSGKFDGEEGLCSDHIRNASHHMIFFMCLVFNAMITHGVCPTSMMIGTMVPIPKIKSQIICKSDNFRAITLSSIMGKLLKVKWKQSFSGEFSAKNGVKQGGGLVPNFVCDLY